MRLQLKIDSKRLSGIRVRLLRKGILRRAPNIEVARDPFGRIAHMMIFNRAP